VRTRYSNITCNVHVLSLSLLKPAACSLHAGLLPQYFHQEHLAGRQPLLTHIHIYAAAMLPISANAMPIMYRQLHALQMQLANIHRPASCIFPQLGPRICSKLALPRRLSCDQILVYCWLCLLPHISHTVRKK